MRMTYLAAIAAIAFSLPVRAESKVGVVNLQEAVNTVDEGKVATAQLAKEAEGKQNQIRQREDEIRKLQEDFQKQQAVMNEETRNQRGEEIARKGQEYQQTYMKLQKELQERERELTRPIFEKMSAIVREIATGDGISVVVDAQAVIYAEPSVDLTDELVRKYNARHKPTAEQMKAVSEMKQKAPPAAALKPPADGAKKPTADAAKPAAKKTGK